MNSSKYFYLGNIGNTPVHVLILKISFFRGHEELVSLNIYNLIIDFAQRQE